VPDDPERFEAPKQKIDDYDYLDDALRHVVRPVVEAERARGQADHRVRDHDHHRHVKDVMAAELGALRVDDVVQSGTLGH